MRPQEPTTGSVYWDETQFYRFSEQSQVRRAWKVGTGWSEQVAAEIRPVESLNAARKISEPVMMLKRVVFTEDLLGTWKLEPIEPDGIASNQDGSRVEFLANHVYRGTRVLQKVDSLFGENKQLQFELEGTWVVKPEQRAIYVYVDQAKAIVREGWTQAAAEEQRKAFIGLKEWEIKKVSEEGIEIDPDQGPRFTLVKQD